MSSRQAINRLKLGPIVGHTDETSSRVWIQASDDPSSYSLRVQGVGLFPFQSTEVPPLEFHTGIAVAEGLRPDWRYRYSIIRNRRVVPRAGGAFRTMPRPGSMANLLFCAISCSKTKEIGAWEAFAKFVADAKPHFVLMMGDQVYIDEDGPNVFHDHLDSTPEVRRKALAEKYRLAWSRDVVRRVMANVPVYMMWDDHEIRDGWGSLASDSPTLLPDYPRGKEIYEKCRVYFEDARDVYWHFQGCHNPLASPSQTLPNYVIGPAPHNERHAMPYVFQCGRLVVLVLDSRGERDVFRKELPILGPDQWEFINEVFDNLQDNVDALAVVTPTPIASMDPNGQVQKLLGNRTDDITAYKRGNAEELFSPHSTEDLSDLAFAIAGAHVSRRIGMQVNLGDFKISSIDEARDQWSHKYSRPEQTMLLRAAGKTLLTNRNSASPRNLIFLSGDIHVGCIFNITASEPSYKAVSLTSSGISAVENPKLDVGVLADEDFAVTKGIHSSLREIVNNFNFGVVQVIPNGSGAEIIPSLAHEGNSFTVGLDFADLV